MRDTIETPDAARPTCPNCHRPLLPDEMESGREDGGICSDCWNDAA